ncbi:NTF2 fold immunity protein, partial [Escherichia coli]
KFPLKELNNPEHDSYAISEKSHGREEKPYEITELTTSWVVEGTIHSDQIAGGVFIIEIGKNDGRILNFGHGK